MKTTLYFPAALVACALALPTAAHEADTESGPLGKVSFPNSCSPAVQESLQRAIAMLHSFWYSAGEGAFRDIAARDPKCALAGWGVASILMSNPLAGQGASPKGAEAAQAAIEAARASGGGTTRERDYLEAVAAYYRDFNNRSERDRQVSRAKAYQELAARYPDDDEAQVFAALYTAGTQTQADQTYAAYLKAAAVLEGQFKKHPDHPGVAHYLIHSYDAPPIAAQGVPAARRYAVIAPAAPHALHMPSHIFTRVGEWESSAATNRRSMDAAVKGNEPDEAFHAADYMVYAYLQLGRDAEARRAWDEVAKVPGASPARFTMPYAANAMPARIAIERGAWTEAASLKPLGSQYGLAEALTHFARALGAARSGDLAGAKADAAKLESIHKALLAAKNNYWATEVEVQRLAIAGWIAHHEGSGADALRFMGAAADLEDRNEKHIVTPGRIVPARELLGDLLMEMKRPAEALVEYEASQKREPNRYRGYAGAARAAAAAGEPAKAAAHYRALLDLARTADSPRPELEAARKHASR